MIFIPWIYAIISLAAFLYIIVNRDFGLKEVIIEAFKYWFILIIGITIVIFGTYIVVEKIIWRM